MSMTAAGTKPAPSHLCNHNTATTNNWLYRLVYFKFLSTVTVVVVVDFQSRAKSEQVFQMPKEL